MSTDLADRYREFTPREFHDRQAHIRRAMAERGLDVALVSDPLNVRWLTGYHTLCPNLWTPAVVLITPSAHVLVAAADGTGLDIAVVDRLHTWTAAGLASDLKDLLAEYAGEAPAIGLELGPGMRQALPPAAFIDLLGHLDGLPPQDLCPLFWEALAVKSETEVAYLRQAASITMAGYRQGFTHLYPGMTERELAIVIRSHWLAAGADAVESLFIAADWRAVRFAHVDPVDSPIVTGQILNVDGGCSYRGYLADIFRSACIGTPHDAAEARLIASIRRATDAAIAVMRPGVLIHRVYEAAYASMAADGWAHLLACDTIGHGIGLEMHEWPTLTRGSTVALRENMVLCVEPWTLDHRDWSHGRNHEDIVRITADGTERLSLGLDNLYIA